MLLARRCAQTALYRILVDFTKLLAPILSFTSQEIWSYVPKMPGMKDYVVFEQMPEAGRLQRDDRETAADPVGA